MLTLEHVAWVLGVSTRTVRRLVASGRLRKLPLDRLVRISPDDFEAFLNAHPRKHREHGDME